MKENNSNVILSKDKAKYIYFILFFIFPFSWALFEYGADVIFYFDQIKGKAIIQNIGNKSIEFGYKHIDFKEQINLEYSLGLKDLKKIKSKPVWDIIYSKNYPSKVALVGINHSPGLLSFIYIFIWSTPLFFYKKVLRSIEDIVK